MMLRRCQTRGCWCDNSARVNIYFDCERIHRRSRSATLGLQVLWAMVLGLYECQPARRIRRPEGDW